MGSRNYVGQAAGASKCPVDHFHCDCAFAFGERFQIRDERLGEIVWEADRGDMRVVTTGGSTDIVVGIVDGDEAVDSANPAMGA